MAVDRLSITVQAELGQAVREAAHASGMSVSSWVADAIELQVRNRLLGEALAVWEAESGPFTADELVAADKALDEAEALGRAARAERAADRVAS